MQNSILISDAQVRPVGINVNVNEGMKSLKCAIKKLAKTESETFTALCDESVTYGEVVKATLGFAAFMAVVFFGGYLMGGVVA